MSTYYYIFAEAQVDGRWMNLNPILYSVNGEYKSSEITYFTHSSYAEVYEAYMEMKIAQMLEEHDIHTESYNVGCMHWNYEPVTLDEILAAGPQIISPPFR